MIETSPFFTASIPYLTAFLAGVFGSVHCIGMCGGMMGAMVYAVPEEKRQQGGMGIWLFLLSYNAGRIVTYTLLGALLGLLGSQGGSLIEQYGGWMWMRVLAGSLMILMGLYLAGWWMGLVQLEKLGVRLIWQWIQPFSKRMLPIESLGRALVFGLFWGLLPCGLVYTLLVWSLAAGGWWQGSMLLLSFGLGTLPTLFTTGWVVSRVGRMAIQSHWRSVAGLLVVGFGLWTIASTLFGRINVGLGCLPVVA